MKFEMQLKENMLLDVEVITLPPEAFIEFEEIFDNSYSEDLHYFLEEHSDLSLVDHMTYYVDRYKWLVADDNDVYILRILKGGN